MSILIISEDGDNTVDVITQWILHISTTPVYRINQTDTIKILNVEICADGTSKFSITINECQKIESHEISAYFYRRGSISYNKLNINSDLDTEFDTFFYNKLNEYYYSEWIDTISYIQHLLRVSNVPSINSLFDVYTNKLVNLEIAKKHGLSIPHTLVSNDVKVIRSFIEKYRKVVTKPVKSPGIVFKFNNLYHSFKQKTNIYTLSDFEDAVNTVEKFQPTQFQEYIEKEFEIRTFYLKNICYSMAIFSQLNEKTKVDYRDYDTSMPNRCVPFKLPTNIEMAIKELMNELSYDSGSIDIIYGNDNYTFLEVNPIGQFGWLSENCNYYLEKVISHYIIDIK